MNCRDYQQDILLMIHADLGFVAKSRVKAHISRCADCRSKRDTLTATSHLIGAAIRPPGTAPWIPAAAARQRRIPSVRIIIGLVILLSTGALLSPVRYSHGAVSKSRVFPAATSIKCKTPGVTHRAAVKPKLVVKGYATPL